MEVKTEIEIREEARIKRSFRRLIIGVILFFVVLVGAIAMNNLDDSWDYKDKDDFGAYIKWKDRMNNE